MNICECVQLSAKTGVAIDYVCELCGGSGVLQDNSCATHIAVNVQQNKVIVHSETHYRAVTFKNFLKLDAFIETCNKRGLMYDFVTCGGYIVFEVRQ